MITPCAASDRCLTMRAPEPPESNRLTVRWLVDHLPITWWFSGIAFLISVFTTGFGLHVWMASSNPTLSQPELAGSVIELQREKNTLKNEIAELRAQERSLKQSVTALEIDKKVRAMSDKQLTDALKKK